MVTSALRAWLAIVVLRCLDTLGSNPWVIGGRNRGSHLIELQHPCRGNPTAGQPRRSAEARFAALLCPCRSAGRRGSGNDQKASRGIPRSKPASATWSWARGCGSLERKTRSLAGSRRYWDEAGKRRDTWSPAAMLAHRSRMTYVGCLAIWARRHRKRSTMH